MKIMLDIGNTRTKFVIKQNGLTQPIQTIDNNKLTTTWLNGNWQKATHILIANVNQPILTEELELWAKEKVITLKNIKSESARFGITNCYEQPNTLGVDRWLTLIGAGCDFPKKNVLIIDSGTATTIDYLTSDGKHQGGWILPGIVTLFESIIARATHVDAKYISSPSISLGRNTSECVNSACWAATIGLIEVTIANIRQNNTIDDVILLGGNANALKTLLSEPVIIEQNLMFSGLQQYFSEE
ncbi:MAG: type III pantothenate kinase [Alteromonadaceae bacterium]|jgi:type III pantothenate kinase